MTEMRTYRVVSRFFVDSWQTETVEVEGTLYAAGRVASRVATDLDQRFGDAHSWTVDIYHDVNGESDGLGSYYQLFHGRLR